MKVCKKYYCLLGVLITIMMLTGCANAIPEMELEKRQQIVEYAAGLVLKHNQTSPTRLVDLSELEEKESEEEENKNSEISENEQPADVVAEGPDIVDNTEEELPQVTIEEFFGLEGLSVQYNGYQVTNKYPEDDSTDLYLVINSSPNSQLVVLEFLVNNQSGGEVSINMLQKKARFSIGFNNGKKQQTMLTMLLNDFSTYQGNLQSGESVSLAIICEISQDEAQGIEVVSLNMRNEADSAEISL